MTAAVLLQCLPAVQNNNKNIIMAEQNYVLSPWQIYCSLFIMFWAIQAYFSSFWMTVLCCLKFGLIAELITDYMYRRGRYKEKDTMEDKNRLNCLVKMAKEEAALVPCLTVMANMEACQKTPVGRITPQPRHDTEKEGVENAMENIYHDKEMMFNENVVNHDKGFHNITEEGKATGTKQSDTSFKDFQFITTFLLFQIF